MDYFDFEVRIRGTAASGYTLDLLESPGGQTHSSLGIPLGDPKLRGHLHLIETGSRSAPRRNVDSEERQEIANSLTPVVQELGQALFAALTQERRVYACYHTSLVQARKTGKGLRLRLRFEAPEIAALPWEYLYDPDFKRDYLSLSKETPIVRHLEVEFPIETLTLEPPIRLLGMVGAREGLDVDREQRLMAQAIEHLTDKGTLQLEWVEGHTWRALADKLRRGPWHVFHFIGHGGFDENTGEGVVLLEDEADAVKTHWLPARDLGTLLADHQSLRLGVLNSCEGARTSKNNLFSSSGAILVSRGISAVVSMQYTITDEAALEFSRAFYDSLGEGEGVDTAVSEARKAIKMTLGDTVEWGTPVLHMRTKSGVLFHPDLARVLLRGDTDSAVRPHGACSQIPLPPAADTQRGLLILLRKVRQFWIEGVLERLVDRSTHLQLSMETMAIAVDSPWGSAPASGAIRMPAGSGIGQFFEEMGGSVLILGEPGSGKTVTLLELARDLLARADQDPGRPVPVVLNLSSWTDPAHDLADWLVDELAAKYLVPKKIGRAWITQSRVLPLLDGLDEVRPERRAACVEAINAFIGRFLLTGTAICCRLKEYLELPRRLALNGAIRLQPLSGEQVLAYTAAAGKPLAALNHLLRSDSGMLIEARSPLLLSLMVEAYWDLQEEALESQSPESLDARRAKLMRAYVERRFRRLELGAAPA